MKSKHSEPSDAWATCKIYCHPQNLSHIQHQIEFPCSVNLVDLILKFLQAKNICSVCIVQSSSLNKLHQCLT